MSLTILTLVLAVWFGLLGATKVVAIPAMAERAAHVGFSVGAYRVIGLLELTGVIGLFVGWAVTGVGVAAAAGFLLLLAGAAVAHLRAGDRLLGVAPAVVSAALVAGYLVVLL
ncbi:DoxX family protein [Streptomyces cylindrosporus]|uniref:DoxX family protein n=1 Tax=Streptomyces cylindrosporus TaxID=2927583 RepID=A0ABS9Y0C1_9ACTN|nr:DoxX family protein [Streptomyces cylindrosporus]MCI3270673.1 DoxX family protein [Streptomyces cylindrosporus]